MRRRRIGEPIRPTVSRAITPAPNRPYVVGVAAGFMPKPR